MMSLTHGGFNTLADRDGFFVIYPTALDGKWNDAPRPGIFLSPMMLVLSRELIRLVYPEL